MNIVQKYEEKLSEQIKKHDELIEAAIRVFNEKGYSAATTAAIAAEAKVSEPTLYKHVKSKRELYLECFKVVEAELNGLFLIIERASRGGGAPFIKLLISEYVDFVAENPHKSKFLVHLFAYRGEKGFEETFNGFMDGTVSRIEKALIEARQRGELAEGIDPSVLAAAFFSQYFTLNVLESVRVGRGIPVETIKRTMERMASGFLNEK